MSLSSNCCGKNSIDKSVLKRLQLLNHVIRLNETKVTSIMASALLYSINNGKGVAKIHHIKESYRLLINNDIKKDMIMEKIKINSKVKEVIINNRTPYSNFAANMFGQDLFKPQTRVMDPDYQDKIDAAKSNGNSDIVLNRSPRRFGIYSITVAGIEVGTNVADEPVLIINRGTDDEIMVPSNNVEEFGKTDLDAVRDAIKNPDKNQVFSDVEFLGKLSNQLNQAEITRLDNMIKFLEKAKLQCESAIGETNNKIKTYKDQKAKSASKLQSTVSAEVNVNIQ